MIQSQVQAVIESVKAVVEVTAGTKVELNKAQRTEIVDALVFGFQDNGIEMSATAKEKYLNNPKELRRYSNSLLTNWLNKSKELNGGIAYEAKNPGSKSDSKEVKQAKALRAKLIEDNQDTSPVDIFIQANAKAKEAKVKELDLSALPEELRALAS